MTLLMSISRTLGGVLDGKPQFRGQQEKVKQRTLLLPAFPGSSAGKESACDAGDLSSIPGSGRSPKGGDGYPLPYSCLENPMDRGAWQATVHGVTKSQAQLKRLSTHVLGEYLPCSQTLRCFTCIIFLDLHKNSL